MSVDPELRERVQREAYAHTENDVLKESYKLKDRFSHIWGYPSRQRLSAQREQYCSHMQDKVVLDYGCGRGESSLNYLASGALVYGIDISANYVEEAKRRAENAGFSSALFRFHVMDAHALGFMDNTFDLVIGEGILHHLSAEVALKEIHRVLKPGGRVLLQEPLADNPLLKLFRLLTPHARTEDEAPFTKGDMKKLLRSSEWISETTYCGLIEGPIAMVTSVLLPNRLDNVLLRTADGIERWAHARGFLSSWNQYVLFNLVKR